MTSVSMDSNKENLPPQDDLMVGILAYIHGAEANIDKARLD